MPSDLFIEESIYIQLLGLNSPQYCHVNDEQRLAETDNYAEMGKFLRYKIKSNEGSLCL